jgi:hypothetical protein
MINSFTTVSPNLQCSEDIPYHQKRIGVGREFSVIFLFQQLAIVFFAVLVPPFIVGEKYCKYKERPTQCPSGLGAIFDSYTYCTDI